VLHADPLQFPAARRGHGASHRKSGDGGGAQGVVAKDSGGDGKIYTLCIYIYISIFAIVLLIIYIFKFSYVIGYIYSIIRLTI
jgi:hypothetical protein